MMLGCQLQLGCGGDYMATFGRELVYGNSLSEIKEKVQARWNKSIGKAYQISYVDENGDMITETFVPKLVKVRTSTRKIENVVGQLDFGF
jgi:hypothetical protein